MLREYLTAIADKFREVLGYPESAVINAQDFPDWIEMTCSMKYGEGYETGFSDGASIGEDEYNRGYEVGRQDGYSEGQQVGYEEGKLGLLDESKYMHPTISGSIIAINDVSPIEHNLEITLSSDTITDFSEVTVSRYGKNLAPPFYRRSVWVLVTENIRVKPNTDYAIQIPKHAAMNQFYVHLVQDAENVIQLTVNSYDEIKRTFNTGNNTEIYLQANCFTTSEDEETAQALELINNNTQLELGTSATSYEPYIEPLTVTANADGSIEGLTSLSPNMTIMTDNDDVSINCQYYRDIDTYIDNLMINVALTGGE